MVVLDGMAHPVLRLSNVLFMRTRVDATAHLRFSGAKIISKLLTQTDSVIFRTSCIFGVAINRLLFNMVFRFMVLMLCEFW
jgi:hypothetical protein